MKQIKQFRYYGASDARNYPDNISNYWGTLVRGNIFKNHTGISHLGIQGIPGTKFYINHSPHPITIGYTGIYELEFNEKGLIYSIQFDSSTLEWYETSQDRLLIDIVYERGL